jgi:hypothetical protein
MLGIMLWLVRAIADVLYWLMQLLLQFLLLMTIAAGRVSIGLWMLTGTSRDTTFLIPSGKTKLLISASSEDRQNSYLFTGS